LLADYNVRILENSTEQLHKDGEVINLSGVHDVTNEREDLDKTLENRVPSPTILISHNPDIKHQLAYRDDVDLVLSGHTHGGQVRLFGFGIRESGGVKQYNFGPLIISNGYGTTRWPIRWGAKPDALVITLECER
jgi:predicted MPP superfamily phosphohydrolase